MAQCPMPTPARDQGPLDPPPSHHASSNPTRISLLSLPEFFKFKGFGSLSSIPRAFALRRVSVAPSSPQSLRPGLPPPHGFLEEPFGGTQDDLNTMAKSPGPYARSSDMYSHMGTMPRLNLGKAGKSLGKAKTTQTCREKDITSDKTPPTAPLPGPKTPESFGSPEPGTEPPSAAGKAEQEEEEAQPMDTPGAVMATMDQKPVGNISCPGTGAPSSSLAPKPSQTLSPDTEVGSETTDGDLPEKGQEHPDKSSSDRYGPIEFALPSAGTPFLPPQGKRRVHRHSGVPAVSPLLACSAGGMHLASRTERSERSAPWPGQRLHGSDVSCGISAPSRFRTGWKHLTAPLSPSVPLSCWQLCSSAGTCCGELRPALS